jgi:hypothetical protein
VKLAWSAMRGDEKASCDCVGGEDMGGAGPWGASDTARLVFEALRLL